MTNSRRGRQARNVGSFEQTFRVNGSFDATNEVHRFRLSRSFNFSFKQILPVGITNSLERIHSTNSFKENVLSPPPSGRNPRIDKGSSLSFSAFRTWDERSSNSNEACFFRKEKIGLPYEYRLLFESPEIRCFITKLYIRSKMFANTCLCNGLTIEHDLFFFIKILYFVCFSFFFF